MSVMRFWNVVMFSIGAVSIRTELFTVLFATKSDPFCLPPSG
ncbi:hypothetical protein ACKUB1_12850 [Methanospirillum stamsii]|nr:hypothetical protein [Methanospirillum stamsii]